MAVNPVHGSQQVILQGTQNVAKQQAVDANKDGNTIAQSSDDTQKKVQKDTKRVKTTDKINKAKINKKKQKDSREDAQENKKKKSNNEEETSTIDIRI